jgi:hypothetical protein
MACAGFERITGTLHGQAGSFVLHSNATGRATAGPSATWTIVPGTGTLTSIHGAAGISSHPEGSHDFNLDYAAPVAWLRAPVNGRASAIKPSTILSSASAASVADSTHRLTMEWSSSLGAPLS